jgi:hypothetical protein
MSPVIDYFISVAMAIKMVLLMDAPTAADWFGAHPLNLAVTATVAGLAGISTLFGNSVVLFLNRVRGWRFAATLALNGVGMVALYVVQALVIAVIGAAILGRRPDLLVVVRAVMLSSAPLVFGVLVLIPYSGPAIGRLLQAWSVVVLWFLVDAAFHTNLAAALVITLVGWGVMQLASWGLSRPMKWLGDRIWSGITGRSSMMTGRDLLSGDFFLPLDAHFPTAGRS